MARHITICNSYVEIELISISSGKQHNIILSLFLSTLVWYVGLQNCGLSMWVCTISSNKKKHNKNTNSNKQKALYRVVVHPSESQLPLKTTKFLNRSVIDDRSLCDSLLYYVAYQSCGTPL